jgi:hypothetical protein
MLGTGLMFELIVTRALASIIVDFLCPFQARQNPSNFSRGIQFKQLKTEFKHAMLELSILNILTWLNTNYIFVYILRDVKRSL